MSRSITEKHKKFLFGSIFISLFLHLAEIHFLQYHALWFSSPIALEETENNWAASMEKKDKDQILKEAFDLPPLHPPQASSLKNVSPHSIAPSPVEKNIAIPLASKQPLNHPTHEIVFSQISFPETALAQAKKIAPPLKSPQESISLLLHLPKEPLLPSNPPPIAWETPCPLPQTNLFLTLKEPPSKAPETPPLAKTNLGVKSIASSWKPKPFTGSPLKEPSIPSLPKIPSLSELQTGSYSDSFETELVFFEKENGEYLFALTLIPREDLELTPLKQNYIFLLDRSNSIQKERLTASKNAVRKAIGELKEDDQFNVIAFDQKVDKLAPTMLPVSSATTAKAHDFLNKIELGSFFSQKNLYKPLFLTVPQSLNPDEIYTAILITDAENLSQKTMMQSLISEWTYMNHGKVALYTIGMNEDSHLDSLNMIASFNRGKSISSPTYRGLKRKLLKLMKTIHSPIAKNISCKAISRFEKDGIELFPKSTHTPHLFQGEPYTILGTTRSLHDFVLFVQGRLNGKWLHIKKHISFAEAKKGNPSLKSEWAQYKAFNLYEKYLEGGGSPFLAEASSLLKDHELPNIFESIQ